MCEVCGEKFRRFASQVKARGPARYCSKACKAIGQGKRVKRACDSCGEQYEPRSTSTRDPKRGRFCTRYCYDDWRRAERDRRSLVECDSCGRSFTKPPCWVARSEKSYCSRRCASDGRHRGASLPRRGRKWRDLAAEIRERDGQICVRCGEPEPPGTTKSLNVDHILPARLFLDCPEAADNPINLASLCTSCHAVKTHRYEPRILRGDLLAIDEFYGTAVRLAVLPLLPQTANEFGLIAMRKASA